MTLDLQQRVQRRMRRAVVALVGIVLVLVATLVVISLSGNGSTSEGAAAPQPSGTAEPTPVKTLPPDDGGYVAPTQTVKLPDGTRKAAGNLPVQFPRTPEGAAAMAVASVRNAWSLDPAQIKAGILTYASAQYRDQMAAAAELGAKGNREFAGVPAEGPVPAGATLNAWPIGVKYSAVNSDTVDVLVLLRVTHAAKAGAEPTTTLVVSPGRAVWEGGDWKGVATNPNQPLPDPVDIGTPLFNQDKWKAIQEGDRV
ncbi:hypothetical protein ABZ508_34195 [Streptomyces lavendulocolor]|uniref:Integral membrane protein n=1 Tax=Streptomyces lavendulocolor TaxID=67316 RepID=A0ABV2WGD5_9ACTN